MLKGNSLLIYGRNSDVDTAATEDVIVAGGTYARPTTTDDTLNIVSSSANDAAAGTGARTVEIYGVSSSTGRYQREIVTLNGTTDVATEYAYTWCHMRVLTAGSGGVNAGNITATNPTGPVVVSFMPTGDCMSANAVLAAPTARSLYIDRVQVELTSPTATLGARASLVWSYGLGTPWTVLCEAALNVYAPAIFDLGGWQLDPNAWLKVRCTAYADNTPVLSSIRARVG